MNSFDFLRKLYRTSKSVVIIANTSNTIFWCTNVDKIKLTEDELKGKKAIKIFGSSIGKLYPGEYIAYIDNKGYNYNVKSYADRTNEFIIVEMFTEPIGKAMINDDKVSDMIEQSSASIQRNTSDIMAVVDRCQANNSAITEEDYSSILQSARQLLNVNRSIADVVEMKHEASHGKVEPLSISMLLSKFAEDCKVAFSPKNVNISLNCVEDIYAEVGSHAFYNLCISVLNRILCISNGYIDEINFTLDMSSENSAELTFTSNSSSNKVRISNLDELQAKLANDDIIGTDLFSIKYFCEKFHAEAVQRINYEDNSTLIKIKLPKCKSQGITLFRCSETIPNNFEKFSKISIAMSEIVPHIC